MSAPATSTSSTSPAAATTSSLSASPAQCSSCGTAASATWRLHRCSSCKTALYCNSTCQRKHWPRHRGECSIRQQFNTLSAQRLAQMTPEERKWKSWLAEHGSGNFVNDDNLKQYIAGDYDPRTLPHTLPARPDADRIVPTQKPSADAAPSIPQQSAYGIPPRCCDEQRLRQAAVKLLAGIESPEEGLGAKAETFAWRQTTREVEVQVVLPRPVRRQALSVQLEPHSIKVHISGDETPVVDIEPWDKIYIGTNADDRGSYWELTAGGRILLLRLDKWTRRNVGHCPDASFTWWRGLYTGGPEFSLKYPPTSYYDTKDVEL